MSKIVRISIIGIVLAVLIGAGLAYALSGNAVAMWGVPVPMLCIGLAFAIQWLAFIPAFLGNTEKFYDITGGITYLVVFALAWVAGGQGDVRSGVVAVLGIVWAVRLASFLYTRIHIAGKDDRFDEIKKIGPRFCLTWTLQGLWVSFTAATAVVVLASPNKVAPDVWLWLGLAVWLFGFGFEVIADQQKRAFRGDAANKGKFISSGLWAISRHPNYFGEIVLWVGMALISVPVLQGGQWAALLSPVFVALLLTRVSGVPLLEAKADKLWGDSAEYKAYKASTPVLLLRLGKK